MIFLCFMVKILSSRSLRARGLKQKLNDGQSLASMVALFTGAWIETIRSRFFSSSLNMSRSLRARGLKHAIRSMRHASGKVALFTGAWIETLVSCFYLFGDNVALFTGAWIETNNNVFDNVLCIRRALYGRVD